MKIELSKEEFEELFQSAKKAKRPGPTAPIPGPEFKAEELFRESLQC